MKAFSCACGQRIFIGSTQCLNCGRRVGFDPAGLTMRALEKGVEPNTWIPVHDKEATFAFRLCRNWIEHAVCNWLVLAEEAQDYCLGCRLNTTIPNLSVSRNLELWAKLESAKHRLLYGLLRLGLPVAVGKLSFAFLEDQRTNPFAEHEHVLTGHWNGTITINVAEADNVAREAARAEMAEPYRTLLGHFRHESGHYYWDVVLNNQEKIDAARVVFGDERGDYAEALDRHYREGPRTDWQAHFVSAYAASHPLEDWAESWAHYLHITDGLETAAAWGLIRDIPEPGEWLSRWMNLSVAVNELNRSLGIDDAYPFALQPPVVAKLDFIHRQVESLTSTG